MILKTSFNKRTMQPQTKILKNEEKKFKKVKTNMKIAIITETYYPKSTGGGQKHTHELIKNLKLKGHTTTIFNRTDNKPFNHVPSKIIWIIKTFWECWNDEHDIYHAQTPLSAIPIKIVQIFLNKPIIITVHGTSINTKLNTPFKEWLETKILTHWKYDKQITVSQEFKDYFNNNTPIFIPNGININEFKGTKPKPKDYTKILFVGRIHKQKNLKQLIGQLIKYSNRNDNIQLHIIGEGEEREELQKYVNEQYLQHIIKFKGHLTGQELNNEYSSSHFFILPSIYEGQPLTIMEAFANKLPIIATDTGDNKIYVNENTGILVTDYNFKEAITKMLSLKNKWKSMGQNGYELIKEMTWKEMTNKTIKVYEKVIKENDN